MNRLDRALAILLLLRGGKTLSAADLSRRFEVSARTIYRDVQALAETGVPVYAEMGRTGGFRLLDGYFLPPVTFTMNEAVSLFLGLAFLRRLRTRPFAADLETAQHKLLAALPDHLRTTLAQAHRIIGVEGTPGDAYHPERPDPEPRAPEAAGVDEGQTIALFIQAILEHRRVHLRYRSPYSPAGDAKELAVVPQGVLWDRDRWYLAGTAGVRSAETKLWRADRVLAIQPYGAPARPASDFDVGGLLNRNWLKSAMEQWLREAPVKIRLTRAQAERLNQDWYYRHARYEALPGDGVLMTFGEDQPEFVMELLRWLGPGAELIEPKEWRATAREQLARMLATYGGDTQAASLNGL